MSKEVIGWVWTATFMAELLATFYVLWILTRYTYRKFRSGVSSVFMLTIWWVFWSYTGVLVSGLASRLFNVFDYQSTAWRSIALISWTVAHLALLAGITAFGYVISKDNVNLYLILRKGEDD